MDDGQPWALMPAVPVGQARVLIVEDDVMCQEILATILRYAGYEVTVAADGRAGFEAVRDGDFDLVLMDLEMPVMSGIEATRRIRDLGGRAGRIPIVAVTALCGCGESERCRGAGMDDFLAKPAAMRQVLQVAARWTGGAAAAD